MKNLRRLARKFDLDQSERKSTQVYVDPGFQLESTCDSVWPGLNSWSSSDTYGARRFLLESAWKMSERWF